VGNIAVLTVVANVFMVDDQYSGPLDKENEEGPLNDDLFADEDDYEAEEEEEEEDEEQ